MEILLISLGVVGAYVLSSLRVLNQYERGVMFFLGKYTGTKGPGLIFVPTILSRMKRVSGSSQPNSMSFLPHEAAPSAHAPVSTRAATAAARTADVTRLHRPR